MKRVVFTLTITAAAAFLAGPLSAQTTTATTAAPATIADPNKVVAIVNGESITQARLDQLWSRMSERTRRQYEKNGGGKAGFLENYVSKRVLIQQALKSGFDKDPAVQAELEAAKESALFDRYVRDVVAASVVSEADVRKFYDDHRSDFVDPERARVREIFINTTSHSQEEAKSTLGRLMTELHAARVRAASDTERDALFIAAADKNSDSSGDMGWVARGTLEPSLDNAIFTLKPGTMSGIIEAADGYRLLVVEERMPSAVEPYDIARDGIREYLLSQSSQKVLSEVNKMTNRLRTSGKIEIYKENIQ